MAGHHSGQSVPSVIPTMPKLGDSSKQPVVEKTPSEPERRFLRPKNLFQGVYFPCMGYIVSGGVLAGTEIFPLSPKQEKLHFMQAAVAPMDHLDGEPNNQYFDSILTHMFIKMESWSKPDRADFLYDGSVNFEKVR